MAHIDALVDKVVDPALRAALREQVDSLLQKRSFGLVFQEHRPETVELPQHRVRRGGKVRVRDDLDQVLYRVDKIGGDEASVTSMTAPPVQRQLRRSRLIVVREFGDPVYPGLVRTGCVQRGGDKPAHVVINAENFHALETLLYTHEGRLDVIYIDPPYNTRDKDWKYNNDYVDPADRYRHSKWLAFMERRLRLARRLLNPSRSVLIVTIGDMEVNRLGLLLEQVFSGCDIQMVTSVINPRGQYRDGGFARCDEYIFFVTLGASRVAGEPDEDFSEGAAVAWRTFRRSDVTSARGTSKGGKSQFYPIYVNTETHKIEGVGAPLPNTLGRDQAPRRKGCTSVFPARDDGTEMNWGLTTDSFQALLKKGYVRVGRQTPTKPQKYEISYLTSGRVADIESGRAQVMGYANDGSVLANYATHKVKMPLSNWTRPAHNAETGGTNLLKAMLGEKSFPYPKSLYAVEDALRYFIGDLPNAIVLDFFGGSGTTTHAVARLNRQDGGRRQSILVTNNEVSASEAQALSAAGNSPGDEAWERLGICAYVTIPRVKAAFTGRTPTGHAIDGDYKYTDEGPLSAGFEENAVFFNLTYEDPDLVSLGRRFQAIAHLLWLKAGGRGEVIESESGPWALPNAAYYGVLFEPDKWRDFSDVVGKRDNLTHAFIVTDSESTFQQVVAELPPQLKCTQLYEDYLHNFQINTRRRR